jgi:hypothetical protein
MLRFAQLLIGSTNLDIGLFATTPDFIRGFNQRVRCVNHCLPGHFQFITREL